MYTVDAYGIWTKHKNHISFNVMSSNLSKHTNFCDVTQFKKISLDFTVPLLMLIRLPHYQLGSILRKVLTY